MILNTLVKIYSRVYSYPTASIILILSSNLNKNTLNSLIESNRLVNNYSSASVLSLSTLLYS